MRRRKTVAELQWEAPKVRSEVRMGLIYAVHTPECTIDVAFRMTRKGNERRPGRSLHHEANKALAALKLVDHY